MKVWIRKSNGKMKKLSFTPTDWCKYEGECSCKSIEPITSIKEFVCGFCKYFEGINIPKEFDNDENVFEIDQ